VSQPVLGALEVASVQTQYYEPFWEFETTDDPRTYYEKTKGFATPLLGSGLKDRLPGDFGFDPLGLKPTDPAELKEIQTKEINNGRLAMLAALGVLMQEAITGEKIFR